MKLKEIHRLSQTAIDDIVEGTRTVFNHAVHRLHAGVRSKLADIGDETKLDNIFSDLSDPFKQSISRRNALEKTLILW